MKSNISKTVRTLILVSRDTNLCWLNPHPFSFFSSDSKNIGFAFCIVVDVPFGNQSIMARKSWAMVNLSSSTKNSFFAGDFQTWSIQIAKKRNGFNYPSSWGWNIVKPGPWKNGGFGGAGMGLCLELVKDPPICVDPPLWHGIPIVVLDYNTL